MINNSYNELSLGFIIKSSDLIKCKKLLESLSHEYILSYIEISKISFVGYGIINNDDIMKKVIKIVNNNSIEVLSIQLEECKLSITTKERVSDALIKELHQLLIN